MTDIAQNLSEIKSKLPERTQLIAVSKRQPDARIDAALAAGHLIFGENQLQEAQKRWSDRRAAYPDLQLHMLGPLQSNKVKDAVALFDAFHALDREKIARKLAEEMAAQNRKLDLFIQVNTGEEEQKSGVLPADLPAFYEFCTEHCGLSIKGLMCMPPLDEPPALHFALLKTLTERLGLSALSMGMSADFEKAIELGATHIRVGSQIFGQRQT